MKKHFITATLYTAITAVLLGIVYPLVITAVARVIFPHQAAGSLVYNSQHEITGSQLLGQPFTGPTYFHSRPSNAGSGYDATSSGGSNLGPTSKALADRVQASVTTEGQRHLLMLQVVVYCNDILFTGIEGLCVIDSSARLT